MIKGPNKDSAEYWSSTSGQGWIDHEAVLDTVFQPVSDRVMDVAGLSGGETVLDIGCGTGGHALTAARYAGPRGHVLATDIAEPFLERTRARAGETGANVETRLADAQTFDFEAGSFDLVTSRFGVMFFQDPAVAFANMARALRQGGQMVFAAWAPALDNPWWQVPDAVAEAHLGQMQKAPPNSPGPMGLSNVDYAADQIRKADIGPFDIETVEVMLTHPKGAEPVAHMMMTVGGVGRALRAADVDDTQRQAVRSDLIKAFAPFEGPDGLHIPARINLIRVSDT